MAFSALTLSCFGAFALQSGTEVEWAEMELAGAEGAVVEGSLFEGDEAEFGK